MNRIKSFEEFVEKKVVKKQSPDRPSAEFLEKESDISYTYMLELIKKMGISDINANDYIKKCYDILMGLIRAKMLLDGYSASGFSAHEAEVYYLEKLGFDEKETKFVNQIRYFRNGMLYYGTILDKEYAEKVISFTKDNYAKLIKHLN